ncbi:ATP-binding protein [Streptomyces sp. NBC_01142]|uniref:ATP-binding protein n=1 Tax=Streptomyces sp. NBC_01142 TaxID=2975865 RepID=UPI00225854DA|nr:ATP-binding protein [Streptomyces sp. NBC_01142]MCX4826059.1 ATP-binding protein [Streptomyces sp. NBC_01142]
MSTDFEIAQRGPGEEPLSKDARRVGAMRRLAKARLSYCGLSGLKDTVALIVSELVTNAITHSGGTHVTFTMQLQDEALYVLVKSNVPGNPSVQKADDDAEHGRGLELVEWCTVTHGGTWGISDSGATVWCLLPATGVGQ